MKKYICQSNARLFSRKCHWSKYCYSSDCSVRYVRADVAIRYARMLEKRNCRQCLEVDCGEYDPLEAVPAALREEKMKKCPMMFPHWTVPESQKTIGTLCSSDLHNCMGSHCAAYVVKNTPMAGSETYYVRDKNGEQQPVNRSIKKQWSCAMTAREVWHAVEVDNASK